MSDNDYPEPVIVLREDPDEAAPNGGAIFWLVVVLVGFAIALLILGGVIALAVAP